MWFVKECGLSRSVVCQGVWFVKECGLSRSVVCQGVWFVRSVVCQGVWFVKECGKALKRSLKWFYRQESEEDLKMERFGKGEEVWEEIMRMIWREMRTKVGTRNALVNAPLMPWLCDPDQVLTIILQQLEKHTKNQQL